MTRGQVTPEELLAARRCLAAAEQDAVDEVLAIRAEAAALLTAARHEAQQLLAAARQQADQILAEATSERPAAMEAIAAVRAQLREDRAKIAADRTDLDAERAVVDAMRGELHALWSSLEAQRAAGSEPADGSTALPADLLEGTQAELAELSQLLDQLVDRVADPDGPPASGDAGP